MALNETNSWAPRHLLSGDIPVFSEPETYVAGAAVVALTVVGRVTASGKLKKAVKTANDGSQKPVGIAVADVDASAADAVGPTYKMGCFNPNALVIDPSFTVEDVRIAFDGTPLRIRAPLALTTF